MRTIAGRKRSALRRKICSSELKIDKQLSVAFRRENMIVKSRRAKYFTYEKKIFFISGQRCRIAAQVRITSIN
jgi:cytidylate kinase